MIRNLSYAFAGCAVAVLAWAFVACHADKRPAPHIPPDLYARIMADLSVAEAATLGLAGYPKDSLQHAYYMQVFAKHQITQAQYEDATAYYARDLDQMRELIQKAQYMIDSTSAALPIKGKSRR